MDQSFLGIDAIFQAALQKEAPAELKAYLDQACQGDTLLRARVERLLHAHANAAESFLESPPSGLAATEVRRVLSPESHTMEQLGTQIGPYKLLQKLGEGGMGTVYMAEQKKPVARRVAVKIIKLGMDSGQVIARFEAERQALAMMDHPCIAKVFEAGATSQGRPYFAMELVKGAPITQYCDEHHLSTKQRLELFVQVCKAVQHAHQKGIIHRDLKPQNILVADYDQKPIPKVIDFGIAKATTQAITEKTVFTEFGQIVGTVEYMSPEQAKLNQLDIDTRTDVYSLGVLLYQLLTGVTPFESKQLRSAAFDEMLRIIREDEPPKPSTRISSWGATAKSLSDSRRTTMQKLKSLVQGDLDWIVMKAIEKDRARRYDTADAFANDVQRYLSNEIVSARSPSAVYRMNKFVRRNRNTLAALAAVIVLVGLSAFVILTVAEQQKRNIRLKAEQEKNETTAMLLVNQVLEASQDGIRQSLERLDSNLYGAKAKLVERAARQSLDLKDKATLNARLALVVGGEDIYVQALLESLLTESAGYVEVIRRVLEPHKDAVAKQLWSELNIDSQDDEGLKRRLHAGIALANYSPDSPQWDETQYAFIANQILRESPVDQAVYLRQVRPIAKQCIPKWKALFTGDDAFVQGSAAYALEYFAKDGLLPQEEIVELLTQANPKQFQILFPLVQNIADKDLLAQLRHVAATPPLEDTTTEDRIKVGQARAGAGIALLRLREMQYALDMFLLESDFKSTDGDVDPEALSQFVHRCRERGIKPGDIATCLENLDSAEALAKVSKDAARYALLLALAEFPVEEVPPKLLEKLVAQAGIWYGSHPSSSVHGATRWLLQSWNKKDVIDRVDQTEFSYTPSREWFTRKIPSPDGGEPTYLTFIVFQPGQFIIGSPDDEQYRLESETKHAVRITRPYAIADREITRQEIIAFGELHDDIDLKLFPGTESHAGPGLNWYESVRFCRWLTERAGMTEENQAYPAPDAPEVIDIDIVPGLDLVIPRDWPLRLERPGYRLATEDEWEVAVRSGARTQYFYGGDPNLLEHYAWMGVNSGNSPSEPRTRKPNLRGLFDMHGNMFEWVHNWTGLYPSEKVLNDWTGPSTGERRVIRGGCYGVTQKFCRNSQRSSMAPTTPFAFIGFRVAMTLPNDPEFSPAIKLSENVVQMSNEPGAR
jgi:serine/threonine protein kinase/formylglycine-generating enzyme required for sulfatase activity